MGMLKTAYRWIAGLAVLHGLALLGAAGFLFGTGRLDTQHVRDAIAVLRGKSDEPAKDDQMPAATEQAAAPATHPDSPEDERLNEEISWRNAERYRTQLEQRLKLINTARMEVDRKREEFDHKQEQQRQEREALAQNDTRAGYEKQVQIISSLSPKSALGQLMSMSDADAAQILFKLDTRKVKRIVESAKDAASAAKMTTWMQLVRDMQPTTDAKMAANPNEVKP